MPEQLLPCPFCGETPADNGYTLRDGGYKYGSIACGCGAIGPDVRTDYKDWPEWRDKAVAEWNQRAIPADQVLVPRELVIRAIALAEDAMGLDFSEHDAIRDEFRALLQR